MSLLAYPLADVAVEHQNGTKAKVAIVDGDGAIVSVNEAWRLAAIENGYHAEGYGVGVNYLSLCDQVEGPDADYARQAAVALRAVLTGDRCFQTFEYVCASEDFEQWAMFIASPLPRNWAPGAAVAHVDITPTKDISQALRRTEERLRQHLDCLPMLVAYVDKAHRYQMNNQAYEAWFGIPGNELRGKKVSDVVGDTIYQKVRPYIDACLSGQAREFEDAYVLKDGRRVFARVNYTPDADREGRIQGLFAFVQDLTKERSLLARVAHQATHDALTGLPNRTQLLKHIKSTIEHRMGDEAYGSLIILDLDEFKDVNDTFGHPFGDRLLRAVAERLTETAAPNDLVARLGGDEFAIVRVKAATDCSCPAWARRLIDRLEAPFRIDGHEIYISTSIGIATFRGEVDDPNQLLRRADLALYNAKAAGRGRYCVFQDRMWTNLMHRQRMTQALRQALHTEQLAIRYQPQIDLDAGTLVAVEALARWRHPKWGDIEPKDFIPIAETSGLIGEFGKWVLDETALSIIRWRQAGHSFRVAVNVSPMQIRHPAFLDQIRHVIAMGVEPDWLELEITEAVLVDTERRDRHILQELADLGFRLAIDDFGSGYSSLAYLKRLPVNKIKIDQIFVRDVDTDPDAEAIVKAIITLGRQLGKSVVAEGVETASQAAFLSEHGCEEAQGFHFARPLPEDCVTKWTAQEAVGYTSGEIKQALQIPPFAG